MGDEGMVVGKRQRATAVHRAWGWGEPGVGSEGECGGMTPLWIRRGAGGDVGVWDWRWGAKGWWLESGRGLPQSIGRGVGGSREWGVGRECGGMTPLWIRRGAGGDGGWGTGVGGRRDGGWKAAEGCRSP